MSIVNQSNRKPHVTKVQRLLAMCGAYPTAQYLKKRGYTMEQALVLMFPTMDAAHRNRMSHIQSISE